MIARPAVAVSLGFAVALMLCPSAATAQQKRPRPTVEGTAVVHVRDREYTLPILCYERGRPAAGFVTDPGPRERRNKSLIRLTGRPIEGGHFKLYVTDGANWYTGTLSDWSPAAGMENVRATVTHATTDRTLELEFRANCTVREPRASR